MRLLFDNFLAALESPEVVLDEECRVEFTHSHVVIRCLNRMDQSESGIWHGGARNGMDQSESSILQVGGARNGMDQ